MLFTVLSEKPGVNGLWLILMVYLQKNIQKRKEFFPREEKKFMFENFQGIFCDVSKKLLVKRYVSF